MTLAGVVFSFEMFQVIKWREGFSHQSSTGAKVRAYGVSLFW